MKRPTLLFVALLAFALATHAQFYPVALSVTNAVPAVTTNVVTSGIIDVSQAPEFVVQATGQLTGPTSADAVVLSFQHSLDQANWFDSFTLALPVSGTNAVAILSTNIPAAVVPYWRLKSIANSNTNALTNLVVTWGVKRAELRKHP